MRKQLWRSFATRNSRLSVSWLDLRGSGLSILERLLLEESLLRHDSRNWVIAGHHEASPHRYLFDIDHPSYVKEAQSSETYNPSTAIVMGIGGKPHELLNTSMVKEDGCICLKRFSGGGTVVLDHDSIWTTLIFRNSSAVADDPLPEAFPRPIMKWSSDRIFGNVFAELKRKQMEFTEPLKNEQMTMVLDNKSCCAVDFTGKLISIPTEPVKLPNKQTITDAEPHVPPDFELRENDYILGNRKMGGNAQTIVKNGWLHHTSFLWDFDPENMLYLTLPKKRPEYREDRSHDEFLVKLKDTYPSLSKKDFVATLGDVCEEEFEIERVTLPEALRVLEGVGGMQGWFDGKAGTRIVADLPDKVL